MAEEAKVHRNLRGGDNGKDVEVLQHHLNEIAQRFEELTAFHLDEDAKLGDLTLNATHRSAFLLGLAQPRLDEIAKHDLIAEAVQRDLRQLTERTEEEKERGQERRDRIHKKREFLAHHHDPGHPRSGDNFVTFDGHLVPGWMVKQALEPARRSGQWRGDVFSGFRTPEFSTSLCMQMCGAPSCPGTCGGASSNHSCPPSHTGVASEGAIDVHDPAGLQRWCRAHGNPLIGNGEALPNDIPHFSKSGH